jgi:tetratricopeptide (TPR) repeat protein
VEYLALALMVGPTPVPEAIRRCERLLEEVASRPALELLVTGFLANLLAMAGRLAEAVELMEQGRRLRNERVGRSWFSPHEFGLQTVMADDPAAAERELRWGYEVQKKIGGTEYFSTITALFARALYAQGRDEESEQMTLECEQVAQSNDVMSNILWRATRALVLARRGYHAAATALAREAVAFAAESDFLDAYGDALSDLAEVHRLSGSTEDARAALEQALHFYEQKGNVVSAGKARALLEGTREDMPSAR